MSLIVTNNTIKQTAPFSGNVDDILIGKINLMYQKNMLKSYLGDNLYNRIITELSSLPASAAINTLIVDYIIDLQSWGVFLECLPHLHYRVKEQGVVNQTGDTAEPTDFEGVAYIKQQATKNVENIKINMYKFLTDNIADYPEFRNNSCGSNPESDNLTMGQFMFSPNPRYSNNRFGKYCNCGCGNSCNC